VNVVPDHSIDAEGNITVDGWLIRLWPHTQLGQKWFVYPPPGWKPEKKYVGLKCFTTFPEAFFYVKEQCGQP
jgi:hypothetical protein